MRIIKRREYHTSTHYSLDFEYADCRGAGFSFPCDQDGKVNESGMPAPALANYRKCLTGKMEITKDCKPCVVDIIAKGVQTITNEWRTPAVGECNRCGKEVELHGFTNTCECGVDYNMSGQELAPRSQWGEETGESVSDILSVDYTSTDDLLDGDDE